MIDLGRAAQRVLGPTLFDEGFSIDGSSEWSITFRDERRSIELSCYREDPTPWLNVVLGLRDSEAQMTVALWRLYPDVAALGFLETGRVDSRELLAARLEMVRDEWLPSLVWPAFEQPERFREVWLAQRCESEQTYVANVLRQRLLRARRAYERGDFAAALEHYTQAGLADLSAVDNRRYVMARRSVEGRG